MQIKKECVIKSVTSDFKGLLQFLYWAGIIVVGSGIGIAIILYGVPPILSLVAPLFMTAQGLYGVFLILTAIASLAFGISNEVPPTQNQHSDNVWEQAAASQSDPIKPEKKLVTIYAPISFLYILTALIYLTYTYMPFKVTGTVFPDMLGWTLIYLVVMTVLIIISRAYVRCSKPVDQQEAIIRVE